jgi:tetratricopeptide (TPR) repeat protein
MWERESDDSLRLKIAATMKKIGTEESLLALYRHPPSPVLMEKCQPVIDELHKRLKISPEKIREILNDESAAKIKAEEEKRKAEELQREQKKKDAEKEQKKAAQRKIALLKLNRQKLILLTGGIFGGLFFLRLTYDTQVVQKSHTIDALTRRRTIEEAERQLLSMAEFLKSRGKFQEAIQLLNVFLKAHPQHRKAEQSKAFCLIMSGRIDEGYQKYSDLAEVVRNSPVILHNLATIDHFYHNNSEKAAEFLKTALNLRPDYLPAQKLLAELYDLKGQSKEAEELRQQVLQNSGMEISKLPPFRSIQEALQ